MNEWSKGSDNWMMFNDFWRLNQMLWDANLTDEYWENAKNQLEAYYEKYGKSPYARDLAMALSNEIERRAKNGKKA